jgi:beta-lactamase regulating signal transducer with metallopeptidase domain
MWQSATDLFSVSALPTTMILAKATLMLLLALGLTFVMQRMSAMSRHLVWLTALAALLFIPAVTMWSPLRLAILPVEWAPRAAASLSSSARTVRNATSSRLEDLRSTAGGVATTADTGMHTPPFSAASAERAELATHGSSVAPLRIASVFALVWASVATALLLWLVYGVHHVRRIIRGAAPLAAGDWQRAMIDIADRLALESTPRLLRSERVTMPFACGLRTPTIVLPAGCDAWSPDRRTAVLLHELGHIKRRDLVGHTLGRVACALYWFHPLVWTAARRLRAESERACDDLALACGTRASDYAEHLLDIVTSVRNHGTPSVAMAMATRSEFEGRMLAILDPTLARVAPTRRQMGVLAGGVLMCALVIGCVVPKSRLPQNERAGADDAGATTALRSPTGSGWTRAAVASQYGEREGDTLTVVASRRGSMLRAEVAEPAELPEAPEPPDVQDPVDPDDERQTRTIRRGAGELMRMSGDSGSRTTALARVLRTDSSAKLRRVAAWGLSELLDDGDAVTALVAAARRDASASVREMAVWALASADDEQRVSDALIDVIRNESDHTVRSSAVWALSEMCDGASQAAVAALAGVLSDTDARLRETAAWGLGQLSPRRAPAALLSALRDSDARVRATAAWALLQIEDDNAATALDAALTRESDPDAKRAMVRALGAMGDQSVDAMQRLIDSPDQELRALAIRALARHSADPWPQPRPRPRPFP